MNQWIYMMLFVGSTYQQPTLTHTDMNGKKINSLKDKMVTLLQQQGYEINSYATFRTGTGSQFYSIAASNATHQVCVEYIKPPKAKNTLLAEVETAMLYPVAL